MISAHGDPLTPDERDDLRARGYSMDRLPKLVCCTRCGCVVEATFADEHDRTCIGRNK